MSTVIKLCSLVALGILLLGAPAPACAEGAYAFSENGKEAWSGGYGVNYATAVQASDGAIEACQKIPGSHCKVIANFANKCFAIAVQDHGTAYGWQVDLDYRAAEARALERCRHYSANCTIKASVCDGRARPPAAAAGVTIPKILAYPLYDNVIGITIFGPIVLGDDNLFKTQVLNSLRDGKLVSLIRIFSPGGSTDASINIGKQIRTLRAETEGPFVKDGVRSCPIDLGLSPTGSPIGGTIGILSYDPKSRSGDDRCRCESGCGLIWMGGLGRHGDFVGIHRPAFDPKFYGGLSLEAAQTTYQRALEEVEPYVTKMGAPDEIRDMLVSTSSKQMHYLTGTELAQMNNLPAFLDELIIAKCGTATDANADETARLSKRTCVKEVLKEKMRVGAKDYLKEYSGGEAFNERP
jgi:hypothetical protein